MRKMKWNDAKNPPDHHEQVLVVLEGGIYEIARYIPKRYKKEDCIFVTNCPRWDIPEKWKPVIHWIEIPKPEEENGTD